MSYRELYSGIMGAPGHRMCMSDTLGKPSTKLAYIMLTLDFYLLKHWANSSDRTPAVFLYTGSFRRAGLP